MSMNQHIFGDYPGQIIDIAPGHRVIAVRTVKEAAQAGAEDLLGPGEIIYWRQGFKNENRRLEWLAGRVAAKYAVYRLLADTEEALPRPDQLEILSDDRGGPVYAGPWKLTAACNTGLSIAHTTGLAVAEAAFVSKGVYPGIDLELRDRKLSERFIKTVFSPLEEDLLSGLGEDEKLEWRLRLWCAREAAVKSLRMGIVGITGRIWAEKIDFETGKVYLTVSDKRRDETESGMLRSMYVQTVLFGSYILAVSLAC